MAAHLKRSLKAASLGECAKLSQPNRASKNQLPLLLSLAYNLWLYVVPEPARIFCVSRLQHSQL